MPDIVLANTPLLANTTVSHHPTLAVAQEILLSLGFVDQRAEVMRENRAYHNKSIRLRNAITRYGKIPDPKSRMNLIKELNKEIRFLKKEYEYIKDKQVGYQQAVQQNTGWGGWLVNSIKQFFGSDNEYQAERYGEMAAERKKQIKKLEEYRDVIQMNAGDISPMRRRLLALPITDETEMDNDNSSPQGEPAIGVQSNGRFIVAWDKNPGVYAQFFDNNGAVVYSERLLASGGQLPDIGVQLNNNFIMTWQASDASSYGIFARCFDLNGGTRGSIFPVNTYTTSHQMFPAIAVQSDGSVLIAWQSAGLQDGSGYGIYARRFDANGAALSGEFRANSYTTNDQISPAVAVLPNGKFVIAWQSYGQNGSGFSIYARLYSSTGSALGSPFLVNTYINNQQYPAIGVLSNGNFVICGQSSSPTSSDDIYLHLFSETGIPLGIETRVNSYTANEQRYPAIGIQANDNIIVGWYGAGLLGNNEIYIQRLNSTGALLGTTFRANTLPAFGDAEDHHPVAVLSNQNFAVSWQCHIDQQNGSTRLCVRVFKPLNMSNNTLTIDQGQTLTISTAMLDVTSGGTASDIIFTLSNIINGQFSSSGNATVQFTKQNIIDGVVKFIHNGSGNAPGFSTTVTDGNETQGPFAATIHFTPAPVVSSSTGMSSSSSSTADSIPSVSSSSSTADASSSSTGEDESSSSTADAEAAHSSSSTGGSDEASSSSSSSGLGVATNSSSSTGGAAGGASSSSTGGVTGGSTGGGSSTADSSSSAHGIAASSSTAGASGSADSTADSTGSSNTTSPVTSNPGDPIAQFFKVENPVMWGAVGGAAGTLLLLWITLRCYFARDLQNFIEEERTSADNEFKKKIMYPIVKGVFEQVKITGFLGYINKRSFDDYVREIQALVTKIRKKHYDYKEDRDGMNEANYASQMVEFITEAVRPARCSPAWWSGFFSCEITPDDIKNSEEKIVGKINDIKGKVKLLGARQDSKDAKPPVSSLIQLSHFANSATAKAAAERKYEASAAADSKSAANFEGVVVKP